MAMAMQEEQRVVVMRHGDRVDHADPLWAANNPRPWDPPLTDAGLLRASTVASRILADGFHIHRVLVSPFIRCLQTAAQAIAALSPLPRINIKVFPLLLHTPLYLLIVTPQRLISLQFLLTAPMYANAMSLRFLFINSNSIYYA
jgi:hypothetical protein